MAIEALGRMLPSGGLLDTVGAIRRSSSEPAEILSRMQKIVTNRPLDINIEITNFCAASCVFCPNSKGKRKIANMSMRLFEKICDEYANLGGGALGLSSMQSDLFADKLLLDRVKYLNRYKDAIYPYSTTYLLGASKLDDAQLEFFLRSLRYLQISLGGVDQNTYKTMYGVNGYEVARVQLSRIKKIVDTHNLEIKLDLMFRTQHDRATILRSELLRELGNTFKTIETRNEFFSWGGIITQDDLPEGAKLLVADNTSRHLDCAVASASMSINVDGSVVGCGCVDWNSRHVVGNVQFDSLQEVWNSKLAVEFRTGFSTQKIPELCKDCSLYLSVDEAFSRPELKDYDPKDGLYYNK